MKLYWCVMLIRLILLSNVIKIPISVSPSVVSYCPKLSFSIIKTSPLPIRRLDIPAVP